LHYFDINVICLGGRGGSRGGYHNTGSRDNDDNTNQVVKDLNVNDEVTSYFVGSVSADQHFDGQEQNRDRYAAGMAVLEKNGVDIAISKYNFLTQIQFFIQNFTEIMLYLINASIFTFLLKIKL
jgi:hypothetical protein